MNKNDEQQKGCFSKWGYATSSATLGVVGSRVQGLGFRKELADRIPVNNGQPLENINHTLLATGP